jgi:hypothetical protein
VHALTIPAFLMPVTTCYMYMELYSSMLRGMRVRARTRGARARFTLIFVRVCVDPCVALAPRLLVRAAVWAGSPPTGTDIHTRLARG